MARWTSSANEAEAAAPSVIIVTLVELDFVGGAVRAHDGIGNLSVDGTVFYGVGQCGGVEGIAEDTESTGKGMSLTLSGIPADMSPDVLAETGYQNRAATIYIGLLHKETGEWIDAPEVLWDGYMDYMDIQSSDGQLRLTLHIEDELRREPALAYYTDEDQISRYAGDRFFADIPNVQLYRETWGQASAGWAGKINRLIRGILPRMPG